MFLFSQISIRSSKLFVTVCIAFTILFGVAPLHGQTVVTSQGTFVLTPPGELVGPEAGRSASRVAEIAMAAVINDANSAISEQNALNDRSEAYVQDEANYDTDLTSFTNKCDSYSAELSIWEKDAASYKLAVDFHDGEVMEYDSRAEDSKDMATYNSLTSNKNRLDNWMVQLNNTSAGLDLEYEGLLIIQNGLDARFSALNGTYDQLNIEWKVLETKFGLAYKQLEMVQKYAIEINKFLKNWDEPILNTINLNTSLEQLKALSNKGWD